jgi:DNA-binding transcriptional LysR family regulator
VAIQGAENTGAPHFVVDPIRSGLPLQLSPDDLVITIKQLEAFYWVANLGSFGTAAARLHVTQSSLSKRVAEFEAALGVELFDRSSRKVRPTDAGHRLLPSAASVLQTMDQLQASVASSGRLSGVCRFGISELAALTWLPEFVHRARELHPDLRLQPQVDLALHLEHRVVRGELDFAIAPGPSSDAKLDSELISWVDFTWAAAPGRFRSGTVLTPAELARHPLITMTEGSGLTRAFERWAGEQGIRPQQTLGCNSLMAIVGLTVADAGISFLPTKYIAPWIRRRQLVAVKSEPGLPRLRYCFIRRVDDGRELVRLLMKLVAETADFSLSPIAFADAPRKTSRKATR